MTINFFWEEQKLGRQRNVMLFYGLRPQNKKTMTHQNFNNKRNS